MDNKITYNFNLIYNELIKKELKSKIAYKMGYTTTTQINKVLDGSSCISTLAIMNLVKNFNVNPNFLYTGEGEMFSKSFNLPNNTKYKIWIEIERINNYGTDDESYSDEEYPVAVGYRDSLKEAVDFQERILDIMGEI